MATTLTTTERPGPTTWRDAVRRLFALASNRGNETQSSAGMFDRAQNTNIQHATFTINQYGRITTDAPGSVEEQRPSESTSTSGSPAHQECHDISPSPRRENPDVYVDCMLSEKRGYPLWTPSPNMSLPALHRTLGVSLGDVGVLTPEGGFEFLFNIFHDASHPVNTFGVPKRFAPFKRPAGSATLENIQWNAGSYLASHSMDRVDDGFDRLRVVLKSEAPEAAVLMIPEDVHAARMHITLHLHKYIEQNIASWYKFVKVTLGRTDIHNGDLRVIYGYRKSTGFGIATTFNPDQQKHTQLTFSKDSGSAQTSGCAYHWSHVGSADVKAGPRRQENTDLGSAEPPRNQCLFVSTIDTKVSAKIWTGIEELAVGVPVDENSDLTSSTSSPRDDPSRQSPGEPDSKETENTSSSYRQYHQRVFHPSAILHNILETMAPGHSVYMVCDDDWALLLNKGMDFSDFVTSIFASKSIIEHPRMAYFNNQIQEEVQGSVAKIQFSRNCDGIHTSTVEQGQRVYHWNATRTLLRIGTASNRIGLMMDPALPSDVVPRSRAAAEDFEKPDFKRFKSSSPPRHTFQLPRESRKKVAERTL